MADQSAIEAVHDWTGTEPDDDIVNQFLGRLGGDVHAAALAILNRRLADMDTTLGKTFAIAGDYSEGTNSMGAALIQSRIAKLEKLTGSVAVPSVTSARLHRPGRGR